MLHRPVGKVIGDNRKAFFSNNIGYAAVVRHLFEFSQDLALISHTQELIK